MVRRTGRDQDHSGLEAALRLPAASRILIVPSVLTIRIIEYSKVQKDAFVFMQQALSDPDEGVSGGAEGRPAQGGLLARPQRREAGQGGREEGQYKAEVETQQATERVFLSRRRLVTLS